MDLEHRLTGVAASEGVAVGPAYVHNPGELEPERRTIPEDAVEAELERFDGAVAAVVPKLEETADKLREAGNEDEAAIFDAHIELVQDPELADGVKERVRSLESPESAVLAVGEEYAKMFEGMEDSYMAARADDVRDVTRQVAVELAGGGSEGLEALSEPAVILAHSLAPSDTARVPRGMALGFVTAEGSKTSHVSIMARSMGIPAVVGVGSTIEEAFKAKEVAINGGEGYAIADPDAGTLAEIERQQAAIEEERAGLEKYKHTEARTGGGQRIEVAANLGSAAEAEDAIGWGAEGVGLFRTEFLFMERDRLPSEEEQYEVYSKVAGAFGQKPVIFRTLDVGGDKDLPGVDQPVEENPFLGWRGIRMCLDVPELFKPQLRALLRAAAHGNVRTMFPMIVNADEVRAARKVLDECREELQREGKEFGEIEVGIMVETPAAALRAGDIAPEVAFFSVGTNDLVQYTLAADRGNEKLRHLQHADHPAVLDLIPKLVDLGVKELSMSAPSIPRAKKVVSEL